MPLFTHKQRNVTTVSALIPILFLLGSVVIGNLWFSIDLRFILLVSALVAGVIAWFHGSTVDQLFETYSDKIKQAFPILLILMAIGGIVGTWMYCGTVPMLIYYGLELIHPKFLLVTAFIVTAIISTFTGTSWGSAATSGVAFLGIGTAMGIPAPMIAGAALSGAVFGDKISPISDTTNLCALASDVTVYTHIKSMIPNMLISALLSMAMFLILGVLTGETQVAVSQQQLSFQNDLSSMYDFNLLMLLPAIVVFVGGYKGFNPVILMIVSSVLAIFIGMVSNGFVFADGAISMFGGFNAKMTGIEATSKELLVLLNRGGFEGMLSGAVMYAILAIGFGSFLESYGALSKLMNSILSLVRSAFGLVLSSFAAGGILNAVSGNAAFSILTIGQMFKSSYDNKKLDRTILSRSMENSMTLLESLIPWHVSGIYMAGIFGVATLAYLPYAFFNLFGVIVYFILVNRSLRQTVD